MKPTSVACLCLALVACAAMAQDGAPAPKPIQPKAVAPAAPKPRLVLINDSWLLPAMRAQLQSAVEADAYDRLAEKLEDILLARLRCGKIDKPEALAEMVFLARAAQYLDGYRDAAGDDPAAKPMARKALAAWLLKHEPFARVLFRAMGAMRNPDDALRLLGQLLTSEEKKVLEYPDLTVALVTAQPDRRAAKVKGAVPQASAVEVFRFYTRGGKFRMDLRACPFEILQYVVDSRLSLEERQWALHNYGSHPMPAKAYFDLKYDIEAYGQGVARKIESLPYTLANLRKVGGVCIDQAYYAAEICKTLGIPAAVVHGSGSSGMSHAWVAYLKVAGGRGSWDSQTGRYAVHQYNTGYLYDPADGKEQMDSALMLTGQIAQLPLERREQADAAAAAARLVVDAAKRGDVEVLKTLAQDVNAAAATKGRAPAAKVSADWAQARRELDADVAGELLTVALDLNLAHHLAWQRVVYLREQKMMSDKAVGEFINYLTRATAAAYPDYAYGVVMRLIPTYQNEKDRQGLYRRALALWAARPDLQCRIVIAMGDDQEKAGNKSAALALYAQAANLGLNRGDLGYDAAAKAEGILRDARKLDAAIRLYSDMFAKTKKPDRAAMTFLNQTAYVKIGNRLATLLQDAGRPAEADRVRTAIGQPAAAPTAPRRKQS
ncbi:MAG: transglutaminase domain-containing protein [Planctomycetaceae bacterium]|nr:transglutaminase-like domain-containing protein [Planctomycetaceae bacterium]